MRTDETSRASQIGATTGLRRDAGSSETKQLILARPRHLVVICGSAGSLDPLATIVQALPSPLDAAVVILIHRPPDKPSRLSELVGLRTRLPVVIARHGALIESGKIYIAPHGYQHLRVRPRTFELWTAPRIAFSRPAADPLFESAAAAFGGDTVAVVLSGMGKNGTGGLPAVKNAGGLVFVQAPSEARCASMPTHALGAVKADLCASAAEIGERVANLCRSLR